MNRGTVIFLALAILLAHTLAIHQTPDGEFAPPYEIAHTAYRLGRNLIYEGQALWNPRSPWAEAHPSPAWIFLSAVAARFNQSPTLISQVVGIACALMTVVVLAQFSALRTSGLIAPLLLAASGTVAAAGASGTEAPAAMLLLTLAFLAFERGSGSLLVLSGGALMLTRPEGLPLVLVLGLLERFDRPRTPHAHRRSLKRPIVALFGLALLFELLRFQATGTWLSPWLRDVLDVDPRSWSLGTSYLWSFSYGAGFGLLIVMLLLGCLRGHLVPVARRALILAGVHSLAVVVAGGSREPFWNALAPMLPLLFLAIQETLAHWLDHRPRLAPLAWSLLVGSFAAAMLVSKLPGDLGPLPLEGMLTAWLEPPRRMRQAFDHPLGREGLLDEIREVESLRPLGVFLRDKIDPGATILTFWPGAIGYLSRKEVYDVLGRAHPTPGKRVCNSWSGLPRVDVLRTLREEPDYLVPTMGALAENQRPVDFVSSWLRRHDVIGEQPARLSALLTALRRYELVCVPVPVSGQPASRASERAFPLLRKQSLGLTPTLTLEEIEGGFEVYLTHKGHRQVADLQIQVQDTEGRRHWMRPTGEWVCDHAVEARVDLLLHHTGARRVLLARAELPPDCEVAELTAFLHNPGVPPEALFSAVGLPVRHTY